MTETKFYPEILRHKLSIKNKVIRCFLGELFGTFLLIFIGECIIAQFILSHEKLNTWIQINIGWGLDVTFAAQCVTKVSGGHLNPAVSVMLFSFGEIDLFTLGYYVVAQNIGAFLGGAATYGLYIDKIDEFEGGRDIRSVVGPNATAAIFSTYPAAHLSMMGAYFDQIAGTGLLCLIVAFVTDKRNGFPPVSRPLFFGLGVILIGTGYGMNIGYPINPARDFGPRIFSLLVYGSDVFTKPYPSWFLVPIIAPCIGGLIGGWAYHFFVGMHIPDPNDNNGPAEEDEKKKLNP